MILFSQFKLVMLLSVSCIALSIYAMDIDQELIHAAESGDIQEVQAFINLGANSNAQKNFLGSTALIEASAHGHKDIVELLIKYRADVNAQDSDGYTALMGAVFWYHKEIVELLLNAGADIIIQTKCGRTALDIAKDRSYTDITSLLNMSISAREKLHVLWVQAAKIYAAQYPGVPEQEMLKYLK